MNRYKKTLLKEINNLHDKYNQLAVIEKIKCVVEATLDEHGNISYQICSVGKKPHKKMWTSLQEKVSQFRIECDIVATSLNVDKDLFYKNVITKGATIDMFDMLLKTKNIQTEQDDWTFDEHMFDDENCS